MTEGIEIPKNQAFHTAWSVLCPDPDSLCSTLEVWPLGLLLKLHLHLEQQPSCTWPTSRPKMRHLARCQCIVPTNTSDCLFLRLVHGYNFNWRGWGTLEYCFIPNGGGFLFTQKYCNALFFRRAERNFEFLNSILGHLQLSFVVGYYLPNLSRDLVLHFDHSKVITLLVESG